MPRLTCLILILLAGCAKQPAVEAPGHDLVVRGGSILDGSGSEVTSATSSSTAIASSTSASRAATPQRPSSTPRARAVAPGFINMLSWAVDSLLVDGRVAERSAAGRHARGFRRRLTRSGR